MATPNPPSAVPDDPSDAVPPEAMPDDLVDFAYVYNFPVIDKQGPPDPPKEGMLPDKADNHKFRWFHIPVNDLESVKNCVARLPNLDRKIRESLEDSWLCKTRPPDSLANGILVPDHSRFMEPSCESHVFVGETQGPNRPIVSLYLPFLNWETYSRCKNRPKLSPTCHGRRTLDQFYYSGLQDTTSRDAGQTVSRWTGAESFGNNGRKQAVNDSLVVMVDQLWLWTLNDESILSFFPSHGALENNNAAGPAQNSFIDVYTSIVNHQSLRRCEDVYDLAALIVKQSITGMFEQGNKKFADLLGIYRWAVANKAAQRTERFQTFSHDQSDLESGALDDAEELRLSLEVADILDELNMIYLLMQRQCEVLSSIRSALKTVKPKQQSDQPQITIGQSGASACDLDLATTARVEVRQSGASTARIRFRGLQSHTDSGIGGLAGELIEEAERELFQDMNELLRLKGDAENTHTMILDLLDLKSKAASLIEARSSTRQGQAVMLFTVVTIIFLPLSFFTSYFGQNVSEYTGDDKNPTSTELWKIAGPISAVVIVGTLLFGYHGINPKSRLWIWKSRESERET